MNGPGVVEERERGVALVLVAVMTAVLVMLALGALALAGLETSSAKSAHAARQAALAAGSGLDLVKHWFDAPAGSSASWLAPAPAEVDRSLRRVDPDGDGTFIPYGGAAAPWNVLYREGRDDLFERPYTGAPSLALEGDASGPDLLIADDAPQASVRGFLTRLNAAAFPSGPGPALALRIRRIAVYAAPRVRIAGRLQSAGVASIDVTASVFRLSGGMEEVLATARASGVVGEIPYARDGPLATGGSIEHGEGLDLRWGEVPAAGDASFGPDPRATTAGGWPWRSLSRRLVKDVDGDGTADDLDGDGASDFDEWLTLSDATLTDPWLQLLVGGAIVSAPGGSQPYPFDAASIPASFSTDDDRSGLFQELSDSVAPVLDADLFRAAASDGGAAAHRFQYVAGSTPPLFREGTGSPVGFEEATLGREGLFYFETVDELAPHDDDGDGTADNLTPTIVIADARWHSSGCIFVNASALVLPASERPFEDWIAPPGEPFDDADGDGTCGAGETYLELLYPADPLAGGAGFTRRAVHSCGPGFTPLASGPPIRVPLTFTGVLLTSGQLVAQPGGRIFGSAAAGAGIAGPTTGARFQLLFDSRLAASLWPPSTSRLPRTVWYRRSVDS